MGLVAVATGDPHELEAPVLDLVLGGQRPAALFHLGHRDLQQLGQHGRLDRLVGHHDQCLDRPVGVVGQYHRFVHVWSSPSRPRLVAQPS
jgi:hypothetical protein